MKNTGNAEKGVSSMTVDGMPVNGNVIPYEKGKKEYHVIVNMDS